MCTNPIQIYNRSSKISYRGQSLIFTVPCGQCEECKKVKSNEYTLRSYFEYQDCISRGGYVYFDTLTYSNALLPKHYGISHFSREDITLMLKELRVYLTRAGFDVKDNLKYFITSEYGGKTHRPHYHVLFYISVPNLDVQTFWFYLNKAWKFGIIDRLSTAPRRVVNSVAAINYVAKYVQKDQEWQLVVDKKLSRLKRILSDSKFQEIQNNIKDYQPFHRQSQGYGANFLNYTSLDDILSNGFITIPDRKYIIKNFAVPTYYKRKLFYNLTRDAEGKLHWHLNDFGKEYKVALLDSRITLVTNNYQKILDNLRGYNFNSFDLSVVPRLINQYLDGRSLDEFSVYCTVYRNKMWSSKKPLPDYKEFYRLSLQEGTIDSRLYDDDLATQSSFRSRLNQYRITQYSDPDFRNFDNLYYLFKAITDYFNLGINDSVKRVQSVRDRLKLILDAA